MIRVFPNRNKWTPTDKLAFVGYPPLFMPEEDLPVRVSVVFTWDIPLGERLKKAWSVYYSDVQIGGPAYADKGQDFEPGRFIKDGVTFTSRGCIRNCSFCYVPKREGKIRELEIKAGHIVQDNNLLACSKEHIENVFKMLRSQNKAVTFSGGLDARLLNEWHVGLFKSIKIKELYFACDSWKGIKNLESVAGLLEDIPQNKKRCYVLLGFDEKETIAEAERRLRIVYDLCFLPFSQLFQHDSKKEYSKEWKTLNRTWSRPAATKAYMKNKG